MPIDARLECLKEAILQEWEQLEVSELGSGIVIRIRNFADYKDFDAVQTKMEKKDAGKVAGNTIPKSPLYPQARLREEPSSSHQ